MYILLPFVWLQQPLENHPNFLLFFCFLIDLYFPLCHRVNCILYIVVLPYFRGYFSIYTQTRTFHETISYQLLRSSRTHCTAGVVMSPSNTLLMIDIKQWLYIRILFYICLCIDFRRGCAKKITQKQNFIIHIKQCSYFAVSYPAKSQNYRVRNLHFTFYTYL